ncbi:hypothetical protein DYB32_006274 [Aphanomyces invadans]|uniref:Uncharacterized protein n=1 Tax=Aphanomyces invadans TaxID=157072 RepID=A0A418ATH5_9STRA|nr:hypothetical protein DYB32_006274 [Aphanomyces invadans]
MDIRVSPECVACIIPAMLLICFEVAYLVHKNRSVNFCGISFDSGHRTHRDEFKSTFLRFAMWVVGLGLLTLKLLVYYRYYDDIVFTSGIYEVNGSATVGTILTIIPAFSLVILSIYIGMRLWNYGSNYAYTVHSTCFNPWIWMMVGSFLLAAGYLMPDPLFARTSNGGEICMLAAIIRMFREVHKDLQEGADIAITLLDGSAAGLHDHAGSPRNTLQESPSTSGASSKYDLIASPVQRRTVEETRLTDASTEAYLSVVIARTKESSAPPRKQALHDELFDVSLAGPPPPRLTVPMLQEKANRSTSVSSTVLPWPASADSVMPDNVHRKSSSIFDEMPLMDFPPQFFGSMKAETEAAVDEVDTQVVLHDATTESNPSSPDNASGTDGQFLNNSFELISSPSTEPPTLVARDQEDLVDASSVVHSFEPGLVQAVAPLEVAIDDAVEHDDVADATALVEAVPEDFTVDEPAQVVHSTDADAPSHDVAPVVVPVIGVPPAQVVHGSRQIEAVLAVESVKQEAAAASAIDEGVAQPSQSSVEVVVCEVGPLVESLMLQVEKEFQMDSPLTDPWEHIHADDDLLHVEETTLDANGAPNHVEDRAAEAVDGTAPCESVPAVPQTFDEIRPNDVFAPVQISSSPLDVDSAEPLTVFSMEQDHSSSPSPLQHDPVPDHFDHIPQDTRPTFVLASHTSSPAAPDDQEEHGVSIVAISEPQAPAEGDPLDLMFSMVGMPDNGASSPSDLPSPIESDKTA